MCACLCVRKQSSLRYKILRVGFCKLLDFNNEMHTTRVLRAMEKIVLFINYLLEMEIYFLAQTNKTVFLRSRDRAS